MKEIEAITNMYKFLHIGMEHILPKGAEFFISVTVIHWSLQATVLVGNIRIVSVCVDVSRATEEEISRAAGGVAEQFSRQYGDPIRKSESKWSSWSTAGYYNE